MSVFSAEQIEAFGATVEELRQGLALALSESLNQLVAFESAVLCERTVDELLAEQDAVVQTVFTLPSLCPDEVLLVFPEADASALAAFAAGATKLPESAEDMDAASLASLAGALQSFVNGMAIAIGTHSGAAIQPRDGTTTTVASLTLPGALVSAPGILEASIPFRIEGALDSTLRLLATPDFVAAVAPVSAETADTGSQAEEPAFGESPTDDPPADGGPFGVFGEFGMAPPPPGAIPFQPFEQAGGPFETLPRGVDLIMDIPLDVTVELGRVQMLIKDVLDLATGSIVELDRVAGEPIDLLVNGQLIAKGEVVVIEDNFGIRITEIVSPADRLTGVGKRG